MAALGLEVLFHLVGDALAIGGLVVHDGDLVELERVAQEGRGDLALRVVAPADAEGVREALLGVLRVGRAGRNFKDLGVVINARGGDGAAAVEVADDRDHPVVHQRLGDVHRLVALALVVEDDRVDLLAEHAALRVPFVDRHPRAIEHAQADLRVRTALRADQADIDRRCLLLGAAAACQRKNERGSRGEGKTRGRTHVSV